VKKINNGLIIILLSAMGCPLLILYSAGFLAPARDRVIAVIPLCTAAGDPQLDEVAKVTTYSLTGMLRQQKQVRALDPSWCQRVLRVRNYPPGMLYRVMELQAAAYTLNANIVVTGRLTRTDNDRKLLFYFIWNNHKNAIQTFQMKLENSATVNPQTINTLCSELIQRMGIQIMDFPFK
jgi:hypothetical protein